MRNIEDEFQEQLEDLLRYVPMKMTEYDFAAARLDPRYKEQDSSKVIYIWPVGFITFVSKRPKPIESYAEEYWSKLLQNYQWTNYYNHRSIAVGFDKIEIAKAKRIIRLGQLRPGYLDAVMTHIHRYNIEGKPVEEVTPQMRRDARRMLDEIRNRNEGVRK